jgi:phospholipase C
VLGPTWPKPALPHERLDRPAGTNGGPIISNVDPVPHTWKSYPEALTAAAVSWQIYQEVDNYGCNIREPFQAIQEAPVSSALFRSGMRTFNPGQFECDAMHDRLPMVSWLVPTSYGDIRVGSAPAR